MSNFEHILSVGGCKIHLVDALRIIFTEIGNENDGIREKLVRYCARKFSTLSKDESFQALLVELPEIATAIITHWNYDTGSWVCDGKASCQGVPQCPGAAKISRKLTLGNIAIKNCGFAIVTPGVIATRALTIHRPVQGAVRQSVGVRRKTAGER